MAVALPTFKPTAHQLVIEHNGYDLKFTYNKNASQGYLWHAIRWSEKGEGLFRLQKAGKESLEWLSFVANYGFNTTLSLAGRSMAVLGKFSDATILGYAAFATESLWNEVSGKFVFTAEKIAKGIKKTTDMLSGLIYASLPFMTEAPKNAGTYATGFTLVGDAADLYVESVEMDRLRTVLPKPSDISAGLDSALDGHEGALVTKTLIDTQDGITPEKCDAVKNHLIVAVDQTKQLRMLTLAKVVVCVVGGLFAMSVLFAPAIPVWLGLATVVPATGAVALTTFGTAVKINLALSGSFLAIYAYFYKQTMPFHLEVKPRV